MTGSRTERVAPFWRAASTPPSPSSACHAASFSGPAGTPSQWNRPSAPVMAKNGACGARRARVKASTKGEGTERRYFYGSVWAVCWAQPALWLMWKVLPRTTVGDSLKLVIFLAILAFVGNLARLGRLPRTRPIVPGELAVSD